MRSYSGDSDISKVVNATVEGLTSPSPSDRYVVGFEARYGLIPMSFLPAFAVDFVLRTLLKTLRPRGATWLESKLRPKRQLKEARQGFQLSARVSHTRSSKSTSRQLTIQSGSPEINKYR